MNLTCPPDEETLSFPLVLGPPAAGTLTATPRATPQWPRRPNGCRRPGRGGRVHRLALIVSLLALIPPLISDAGPRLNPNLSDGPEWGATVGNAVRVWRSGLGIDRCAISATLPPTR